MTLIKTSLLTGCSTIIRIISGFLIYKIIAVRIGPAGIALLGQFQNFSSAIMTLAGSAVNTGIVKYTAEYRNNYLERNKLLSSAFAVAVLSSLVLGAALIFLRSQISAWLLNSSSFSSIFLIFGLSLIFFVLNTFLLSILNGHKEIKKYVLINIVSNLVTLGLISILSTYFGFYGVLLSYILSQSVVFFITFAAVFRCEWFSLSSFVQGVNWDSLIKLAKYGLMIVVSALLFYTSQMVIRNYIGTNISWDAAGCWQGVWRISDTYLLLITTSMGIYYTPRLAEIQEAKKIQHEVFYGYRIIMPIVILVALFIFVVRDNLILILFTDRFTLMRDLFVFQLLGDIFKIASWLLSYIMVAKAMTRLFLITEIIFTITFLVFSIVCMKIFGLIGVTYAFALNYFLYLLTLLFCFRDLLLKGRFDY